MPVQTYCADPKPAADERGTERLCRNALVQLAAIFVPPGENTGVVQENDVLVAGMTQDEYGAVSSVCAMSIQISSQLSWLAGSEAQISSLSAREVPSCVGKYAVVVRNSIGVKRMTGKIGDFEGAEVEGERDGDPLGAWDGDLDGCRGAREGVRDGDRDGERVGVRDGARDGLRVGACVGGTSGERHAHATRNAFAAHVTGPSASIHAVPATPVAPAFPLEVGDVVDQYEHV